MRKAEMKQIVLEHFVDDGKLKEFVLDEFEVGMTSSDLKEVQLAKLKYENESAKNDHALAMNRLDKGISDTVPLSNPSSVFDATNHIRLVPQFHEDDVDKYFVMFEKVAHSLNWPKDKWVLLLQSVLKSKAQHYSALSITACESYDTVKEAIKKAYELVPEAYRQQFRELKRKEGLTYVEYAHDKETLFDRWCVSREVGANFENLKQLVLVEEFKRSIPSDIRSCSR